MLFCSLGVGMWVAVSFATGCCTFSVNLTLLSNPDGQSVKAKPVAASGQWPVASGEWQVASGKWLMASGQWRMASGAWRISSGKVLARSEQNL